MIEGESRRGSWLGRWGRLSLGVQILVFMVLGGVLGAVLGERAGALAPIGQVFIRLLVMAAIPLVFFSLMTGLTSLNDPRLLGRLGGRFIVFFVTTSTIAICLGLAATAVLQPGRGLGLSAAVDAEVGQGPSLGRFLLDLAPENIFAALAEGNVLQIVVFALLAGVAALRLPTSQREQVHRGSALIADLLVKLIELILLFAPLGIGALTAVAVGEFGSRVFGPLLLFIASVWLAQLIMVGVFMAMLATLGRQSPLRFLRDTAPLYATAAATCSSLASLSVALKLAEETLRLPRTVYAFILPLGTQLSKEGTAIMLASVVLFTAQSAGVRLDWQAYPSIVLVTLLLSGASGGFPGGGLVKAFLLVQAFNLPLEVAAVVAGVYRLVDMGNTTLNVMGDIVGARIVAGEKPAGASADP